MLLGLVRTNHYSGNWGQMGEEDAQQTLYRI